MSEPSTSHLGIAGRIAAMFIDSKLTPLIVIASVLLGAAAVVLLPREEEPQIKVPMVDVMVSMPGSSAKEIEERATRPMEKLLWEISGVEYIYSTSRDSESLVIVRFKVGEDPERSLFKLTEKLRSNFDRIPMGVTPPLIKPKSIDDVPILALTFHSARYDHLTLRRLAAQVDESIKQVPLVAETTLLGGSRRAVRVMLDPVKLASRNLSPAGLVPMLQQANRQFRAGGLTTGNNEVLVETGAFLKTAEDVGNVVIGVFSGRPVYLREVAEIVDGGEEPTQYVFYGRGRSGILPDTSGTGILPDAGDPGRMPGSHETGGTPVPLPQPITIVEGFTYTPYPGLSLEERRIEVKFAAELAADLEAAAVEYKRRFANVLDRNNVQELSPDYAATRESRQKWSIATLEPAGAFVDWMFEKTVSAARPGDVVLFNAGGQGSGKTTATEGLPKHERVILIMDGTLQNHRRSREHFQRAFECGCALEVRYIHAPWPLAVRNMLKRAIEGTGRVVPLSRAANGHYQVPITTLRLVEEFGEHKGFRILVLNNFNHGYPIKENLEWLAGHLHNSVDELLKIGELTLKEEFNEHTRNTAYSDRLLAQFLAQAGYRDCASLRSARRGHDGTAAQGGPGLECAERGAGQVSGHAEESLTSADLIPAEAAKQGGGKIIMATVKGDVHDIGKN
ncbi:MAG TPA: hypothetical protein DDZ88_23820, partial [Verrucomicrobiales bacterium]|nr:hypothetical protein [Verrucomicrobiales bacterium]